MNLGPIIFDLVHFAMVNILVAIVGITVVALVVIRNIINHCNHCCFYQYCCYCYCCCCVPLPSTATTSVPWARLTASSSCSSADPAPEKYYFICRLRLLLSTSRQYFPPLTYLSLIVFSRRLIDWKCLEGGRLKVFTRRLIDW